MEHLPCPLRPSPTHPSEQGDPPLRGPFPQHRPGGRQPCGLGSHVAELTRQGARMYSEGMVGLRSLFVPDAEVYVKTPWQPCGSLKSAGLGDGGQHHRLSIHKPKSCQPSPRLRLEAATRDSLRRNGACPMICAHMQDGTLKGRRNLIQGTLQVALFTDGFYGGSICSGQERHGKTTHCVEAMSRCCPVSIGIDSIPIFLVPEQATYEAERAILSSGVAGYHRLRSCRSTACNSSWPDGTSHRRASRRSVGR